MPKQRKPHNKIINEKNFCVIAGKNSETKNMLRGGANQMIFTRMHTYIQDISAMQ